MWSYAQPRFGPERGYLAVMLDGGLEKTFARRTVGLGAGTSITIAADAEHAATFGDRGARVLVVRPSRAPELVHGVRDRRDPGIAALARRIAGELRATDAAAPVAVEGLALELVSAAVRAAPNGASRARPAWLRAVVEQIHAEADGVVSISELADAANVHPAHLARVFRRHYGVSVGTYFRRLRLDRAAARLTDSDEPVARVRQRQAVHRRINGRYGAAADAADYSRSPSCRTTRPRGRSSRRGARMSTRSRSASSSGC